MHEAAAAHTHLISDPQRVSVIYIKRADFALTRKEVAAEAGIECTGLQWEHADSTDAYFGFVLFQ